MRQKAFLLQIAGLFGLIYFSVKLLTDVLLTLLLNLIFLTGNTGFGRYGFIIHSFYLLFVAASILLFIYSKTLETRIEPLMDAPEKVYPLEFKVVGAMLITIAVSECIHILISGFNVMELLRIYPYGSTLPLDHAKINLFVNIAKSVIHLGIGLLLLFLPLKKRVRFSLREPQGTPRETQIESSYQ